MSEALESLVPVLAQRRRCGRAPWRSQQLQIHLVSALGDGDAEPIGQLGWGLSGGRDIPSADKKRCDRGNGGVEPGFDAPLDAAQVGFRRGEILLPRKQKRDIDRDTGKDRGLNSRQPLRGARNFDKEVGLSSALAKIARRRDSALRVMRKKRRNLERHPAIDAVRTGEHGLQQIGSPGQIG